jgi:beta-mannanase
MTNYAAMVGGTPSIVMWYQKWAGQAPTAFPTADVDRVVQFGATPMITWEACDPTPTHGVCQTSAPSIYTNKNVAAGMFDAYVTAWAQAAKAWGKPFFLRLNHEMNGVWYPWGTAPGNPNQNAPEDYVAAWKHLHQVLDSVGVKNATWVWSPNVGYPPLAADYPGDDWVDWVALDGYNWGTYDGNQWTSFKDVFAASYTELTSLTNKPLMFAETASAPGPGDKATWITQGLLCDLPTYFPQTRAVIWFDNVKETDWRVNSSSASLDAWRSVVGDPRFQAGPLL